MGPLMCIVFGFLAAYISYLIAPGEDQTPWGWRMYVCGGAGLLLGAVLQRKRLPVDNITITLFTFFTTLIIYGGIMNAAMLTWTGGDFNTLRLLYISGFIYDLGHVCHRQTDDAEDRTHQGEIWNLLLNKKGIYFQKKEKEGVKYG